MASWADSIAGDRARCLPPFLASRKRRRLLPEAALNPTLGAHCAFATGASSPSAPSLARIECAATMPCERVTERPRLGCRFRRGLLVAKQPRLSADSLTPKPVSICDRGGGSFTSLVQAEVSNQSRFTAQEKSDNIEKNKVSLISADRAGDTPDCEEKSPLTLELVKDEATLKCQGSDAPIRIVDLKRDVGMLDGAGRLKGIDAAILTTEVLLTIDDAEGQRMPCTSNQLWKHQGSTNAVLGNMLEGIIGEAGDEYDSETEHPCIESIHMQLAGASEEFTGDAARDLLQLCAFKPDLKLPLPDGDIVAPRSSCINAGEESRSVNRMPPYDGVESMDLAKNDQSGKSSCVEGAFARKLAALNAFAHAHSKHTEFRAFNCANCFEPPRLLYSKLNDSETPAEAMSDEHPALEFCVGTSARVRPLGADLLEQTRSFLSERCYISPKTEDSFVPPEKASYLRDTAWKKSDALVRQSECETVTSFVSGEPVCPSTLKPQPILFDESVDVPKANLEILSITCTGNNDQQTGSYDGAIQLEGESKELRMEMRLLLQQADLEDRVLCDADEQISNDSVSRVSLCPPLDVTRPFATMSIPLEVASFAAVSPAVNDGGDAVSANHPEAHFNGAIMDQDALEISTCLPDGNVVCLSRLDYEAGAHRGISPPEPESGVPKVTPVLEAAIHQQQNYIAPSESTSNLLPGATTDSETLQVFAPVDERKSHPVTFETSASMAPALCHIQSSNIDFEQIGTSFPTPKELISSRNEPSEGQHNAWARKHHVDTVNLLAQPSQPTCERGTEQVSPPRQGTWLRESENRGSERNAETLMNDLRPCRYEVNCNAGAEPPLLDLPTRSGFSTASGRTLRIDAAALRRSEALLGGCDDFEIPKEGNDSAASMRPLLSSLIGDGQGMQGHIHSHPCSLTSAAPSDVKTRCSTFGGSQRQIHPVNLGNRGALSMFCDSHDLVRSPQNDAVESPTASSKGRSSASLLRNLDSRVQDATDFTIVPSSGGHSNPLHVQQCEAVDKARPSSNLWTNAEGCVCDVRAFASSKSIEVGASPNSRLDRCVLSSKAYEAQLAGSSVTASGHDIQIDPLALRDGEVGIDMYEHPFDRLMVPANHTLCQSKVVAESELQLQTSKAFSPEHMTIAQHFGDPASSYGGACNKLFGGFSTASGRHIVIDEAKLRECKHRLDSCDDFSSDYAEQHKFEASNQGILAANGTGHCHDGAIHAKHGFAHSSFTLPGTRNWPAPLGTVGVENLSYQKIPTVATMPQSELLRLEHSMPVSPQFGISPLVLSSRDEAGEFASIIAENRGSCVGTVGMYQPTIYQFAAFAWFRREIEASFPHDYASGNLARFGQAWFETQRLQLAISHTVAGRELFFSGGRDVGDSFWLKRMVRRCRTELGGGRSAFRQICSRPAIAGKHMLLICTRVPATSMSYNHVDTIEVSDGWYFLPAKLDAALWSRVRTGQIRPGRKIHVCNAKIEGFLDNGSDDPLELSPQSCLQIVSNGCRPAPMARDVEKDVRHRLRLGPKQTLFPVARISELIQGAGIVPLIDVLILRAFPVTLRSWGEKSVPPEEWSISQDCERAEQLSAEDVNETHQLMLKKEPLAESGSRAAALQMQISRDNAFAVDKPAMRLTVLVMDVQQIRRSRDEDWLTSLALLYLPGADEDYCPGALDRLRVTGLHPGTAAPIEASRGGSPQLHGPLRLYHSRGCSIDLQRGTSASALGIAHPPPAALHSFVCLAGEAPIFQVPPPIARGHYADLVGVLLSVGIVEPPSFSKGRWMASLRLVLLTHSMLLCTICVQERSSSPERAAASLQRARAAYEAAAKVAPAPIGKIAEHAAVAAENVSFAWHERRTGVVHFNAQRLQLRLSRRPTRPGLRRALARAYWSPPDVARARAWLQDLT